MSWRSLLFKPDDATATQPPLPPVELRRLVCHDDALFELPHPGNLVFPRVSDAKQYQSVFDFGCGCGRIARQLIAQDPRPSRYVGVDIHRGMIEWCQSHLTSFDPSFQFHHHDVWNLGLGSDNTRQATAPFPVSSKEFTLVVAHSIFTHLYKEQTVFYLAELARILRDDGVARTTWFLFDRSTFPMLFDFQVTLFVNEVDPTNAVIYDWQWLLAELSRQGLRISQTAPPSLRGHQWELYLEKCAGPVEHNFPKDPESHFMMTGTSTSGPVDVPPAAAPAQQEPQPEQVEATPASAPEPTIEPVVVPPVSRHLLRFTGDMSAEEFQARCAELPWWYHSYYFDNGYSVRGDYDIGADVNGYGFPPSMKGWRVLDIGTGAGWFALYFEQLGAEVVTVDARGYSDFDVYGRGMYPPFEQENRQPDRLAADGTPLYYSPVSRGFWTMKDILNSRVQYKNARVYDVNPDLFQGQTFDLVFMGAILCHLRDPIGALMAARSVCRHRVIAATPVVLGETEPGILPRQYLPYTNVDNISWWLPNEACFRHWFLAAGFLGVDVSRQITLRGDVLRHENGRFANGDQTLRVGSAFVP